MPCSKTTDMLAEKD